MSAYVLARLLPAQSRRFQELTAACGMIAPPVWASSTAQPPP